MIFVCSRLGIPIFSYGENGDLSALSKLVVTVGALSPSLELFQISVGDFQYTAKPFVISEHWFYCVCCVPDEKHANLTSHMLGNTIQCVFWEEFFVLLGYLDRKSAAEINNSTIMDTLGGERSNIQDIINEVFAEERVCDSFLMFEEHFMRGLASSQIVFTFARWFEPLCSLRRTAFSFQCNDKDQPTRTIPISSADLFLLEFSLSDDAVAAPLHNQLYSARIIENITDETMKPSANRKALSLDARSVRIIQQYCAQPNHHTYRSSTDVKIVSGSTMLVLSVISGNLVMVLRCSYSDELSQPLSSGTLSAAAACIEGKGSGLECLTEELQTAWRSCCSNIATALPRPTKGPREGELTAELLDKML